MEIQPWKSPFDDTIEEQFYTLVLDALCDLKGVTYTRTQSTQTASEEQEGKRIYTFEFSEEMAAY